jgi:hypothetical protein
MYTKEKLLEMLTSKKASVRYDACEWLRVRQESSPEIVTALEKATHDEDKEVAERAKLALHADIHHQKAIEIGMIKPDKVKATKQQTVVSISPENDISHQEDKQLPTKKSSTRRQKSVYYLSIIGLVLIILFIVIELIHQRNRHASWEFALQEPELSLCSSSGHDQIFSDSQGRIWVYPYAKYDGGVWVPPTNLCMYDDKTWKVFTPSNSTIPDGVVFILGEDAMGRVWMLFSSTWKYDGNGGSNSTVRTEGDDEIVYFYNDTFNHYFNSKDLNYPNFDEIDFYAIDQVGRLWIVFNWCIEWDKCGEVLSIYDGTMLTTYDYRYASFPQKATISDIQFDSKGRTWVASKDYIFILENGIWKILQLPDWISESGYRRYIALAESGEAWVYGVDDIALLKDGQWLKIPKIPNLAFLEFLLDQNGLPWVASRGRQVYHYDGESWKLRANSFVRWNIYPGTDQLQLDTNGELWVTSNNGALIINDRTFHVLNPDNSFVGWYVLDIAFDAENRVWVSSNEGIAVSVSEFSELYLPPRWFLSIRHVLVTNYRWLFPSFLILFSLAIYLHMGTAYKLAIGLGMILVLFTHLFIGIVGAGVGMLGAVIGGRIRRHDFSIEGAIIGVVIIAIIYLISLFILYTIG